MNKEQMIAILVIILLSVVGLFIIGFLVWLFRGIVNQRKDLLASAIKKNYENLTSAEKEVALEAIMSSYQHKKITFTECDILTSKIKGVKSATEISREHGFALPTDASAHQETKSDGTKTIVRDAVIGGVVAGPAGAVVGAIVGKNKSDNENKT